MQKLFDEMICPQCGKMFVCWDRGAWKYKKTIKGIPRFFCKWSCFKQYKAKAAAEQKKKRAERGLRRRKENSGVQQVQEMR